MTFIFKCSILCPETLWGAGMNNLRTELIIRLLIGFLIAFFFTVPVVIAVSIVVILYRGYQIFNTWEKYEGFSQLLAFYFGAKGTAFLVGAWMTVLMLHRDDISLYLKLNELLPYILK